jgi:hypothetical protein
VGGLTKVKPPRITFAFQQEIQSKEIVIKFDSCKKNVFIVQKYFDGKD